MASYIADSGSYSRYAELTGTYTTDEANKVTTFAELDGQADTLFVFPTASEWVLIEVFDVETVKGAIGYQVFKTKTYNLPLILSNAQAIASNEYLEYVITAVHYKGSNVADIYRGDEFTPLTLNAPEADFPFTPPVDTWKINYTSVSPSTDICVTLGTDGTRYGCDGVFGSLTPDVLLTDQTFYSLSWAADGTFIMQFGVTGDEQVPDVVDIKLYTDYQIAPLIMVWNSTTEQYEDTDATLAGLLIADQVGGETKICFEAELLPIQLISYGYDLETV